MAALKVWDGTQWIYAGAGPTAAAVGSVAPTGPVLGQLWDDTSDTPSSGVLPSWVDDLVSANTYNMAVTATAIGTVISSGGPFNITVPAGRTLEVHFKAPVIDTPASTGMVVAIRIAGAIADAGYWSNSNANSYACPGSLMGLYVGTGVSVAVQVEAYKVGAGTPALNANALGLAPVRIRHRIT